MVEGDRRACNLCGSVFSLGGGPGRGEEAADLIGSGAIKRRRGGGGSGV